MADRRECKSPLVLLVFKRPGVTSRVFEAVRAARPPKLLVVADGPRHPGEREACLATRAVTEAVDWDCEVLRDYSETNLGCRRRVSSGLDWAFRNVEEAIILEEDCLPHPSFFGYCDALLERYRDDPRVWMIVGPNFQGGDWRGNASYFFSRYSMIWGWATWRRAWRRYDGDLDGWPAFRDSNGLQKMFGDPFTAAYWHDIFERLHVENVPDSWAYRWTFSSFAGGGLAATPNVNLVSNIGFGADATHTVQSDDDILANRPLADLGAIRHPAEVAADAEADRAMFDIAFRGAELRREAEQRRLEAERQARRLSRRIKSRWDAFRRLVGPKR